MVLDSSTVTSAIHWLRNYFFLSNVEERIELPVDALIGKELGPAGKELWDYISFIHLMDEYGSQPEMIKTLSNGRYTGHESKEYIAESLFIGLNTRINFLEIEEAFNGLL